MKDDIDLRMVAIIIIDGGLLGLPAADFFATDWHIAGLPDWIAGLPDCQIARLPGLLDYWLDC